MQDAGYGDYINQVERNVCMSDNAQYWPEDAFGAMQEPECRQTAKGVVSTRRGLFRAAT